LYGISVDGWHNGDIPMFRGQKRLSNDMYLWLTQDHLKKDSEVILCNCINPQIVLAFLAGSSGWDWQ
jgi:hypothetical protein